VLTVQSLRCRCFLPLILRDGLVLDAHGQNILLRFSRSTGALLGFSARDSSSTRFSKEHYERSSGMSVDTKMISHIMPVKELMERAHWIMMLNHLSPMIYALDLNPRASASFTARELEDGQADEKLKSDVANYNGCAVMASELHDILREHETLLGDDASSVNARELAKAARKVWLEATTWPMQCFISQRMRSDWAQRDKNVSASTAWFGLVRDLTLAQDRASFRDVPSVIVAY
jgi:hypothetical protein